MPAQKMTVWDLLYLLTALWLLKCVQQVQLVSGMHNAVTDWFCLPLQSSFVKSNPDAGQATLCRQAQDLCNPELPEGSEKSLFPDQI